MSHLGSNVGGPTRPPSNSPNPDTRRDGALDNAGSDGSRRSLPLSASPRRNAPLNSVLVHPSFKRTVAALREAGVVLPRTPWPETLVEEARTRAGASTRIAEIEAVQPYPLDARRGRDIYREPRPVCAYDESINKFVALEGAAYFTAHSVLFANAGTYLPTTLLTSSFYTRSQELARLPALQLSSDPRLSYLKDYINDRMGFMRDVVPPGSIFLVDGPIIAGDVYTTFLPFIKELHDRGACPIFVVKNSDSTMVIDSDPNLSRKFNSDLHWAYHTLHRGERSALFQYTDPYNPRNTKVFCYVKSFNASPLRVEVHTSTYERYGSDLRPLLDMLYFLSLAQGKEWDPQPRPIAVAEMYARETLGLVDIVALMRLAGVIPSVNQSRFGG